MIQLKSNPEIEAIARSGEVVSALFKEIEARVEPGVATKSLDRFVGEFVRSHDGAIPAFKGLYGFPGNACISINEEVVHGIPSRRKLREGDIVSVDVGVRRDGWCADSAYTFAVGEIGPTASRLLEVTREALRASVAAARPKNRVGDIGAAVVRTVQGTGFGIVRDLVGHGIGREIHEEPQVANVGRPGVGPPLAAGMVLAIEPMLSAGSDAIRTRADKWTVATFDGALSAHFEHTVAVTQEGPIVLTGGGIWEATEPVPGAGAVECAGSPAASAGSPAASTASPTPSP